ncbi:hypothetical protein [Longimicrobium sp.]|uniref:hypothetical protein n=1 Tax=Longimicrobium sp. TaxID=2029185 RepID=UPI003B3A5B26
MTRTPGRTNLSREQFHALTRPLVGMPVSHAWRGFGSAMFLELGELTTHTRIDRKRGKVVDTHGEVTLMLEWSWRVESPGAIQFGSWSENPRMTRGVASLEGHTILDVQLEGRLPELVLTLDGKRWLHTFMTAEGQPVWAIRLRDDAWLGVNRGHLYRQGPEREWQDQGDAGGGVDTRTRRNSGVRAAGRGSQHRAAGNTVLCRSPFIDGSTRGWCFSGRAGAGGGWGSATSGSRVPAAVRPNEGGATSSPQAEDADPLRPLLLPLSTILIGCHFYDKCIVFYLQMPPPPPLTLRGREPLEVMGNRTPLNTVIRRVNSRNLLTASAAFRRLHSGKDHDANLSRRRCPRRWWCGVQRQAPGPGWGGGRQRQFGRHGRDRERDQCGRDGRRRYRLSA